MTRHFALPVVEDAVWPARGSTTGRAIESAGRRALFEALKDAAGLGTATPVQGAAAALRESFVRRLPGQPHAISHHLDDVRIATFLRAGLDGDAAAFPEGVRRLRVALGDEAAVGDASTVARAPDTPAAWAAVADDAALGDLLAVARRPFDRAALVAALTAATTALAAHAPALHDERRRFLRGVVVGACPEALPPGFALGVVVLPEVSPDAALAALVETTVRSKLHTLASLRGVAPASIGPLVRRAVGRALARVESAAGRVLPRPYGDPGPTAIPCDAPDAFADVSAELARLAA